MNAATPPAGGATDSLARGAATITLFTALSRITGFVRVVAVAAAMGVTFLANTYQSANTAPNLVFELVAAGVLTSVFVPTFVEFLVKGRREEGWDAANALTTVALVALTVISIVVASAAPLIMRVLLIGVDPEVRDPSISLGTSFLRLFAPQIVFYGAGMIMTSALHAYRRFALPAVAPIFNNVIVIGVYLTYAVMRGNEPPDVRGISAAETWLLGAGTTMGVVAMTLCLLPGLRRLGWRFRWRFEPGHPAVRRGARLGAWALGYAGGYQAGLIVVLVLANSVEGGVAAYQWAFTFFYLPHALFGVPIFNVLFTAMAEHAAQLQPAGIGERLRDGLGMLAFILFPVTLGLVVLAQPIARLTLDYGVMTEAGAALVGRVLGAFAIGLPTYSAFLIFTRASYAVGDTRTPTLVNALAVATTMLLGWISFVALPEGWEVAGLALGHSAGFALGCVVLGARVTRSLEVGPALSALRASLGRSGLAAAVAGAGMLLVHTLMPDASRVEVMTSFLLAGGTGVAAYVAASHGLRSPELAGIAALGKSLLRRSA